MAYHQRLVTLVICLKLMKKLLNLLSSTLLLELPIGTMATIDLEEPIEIENEPGYLITSELPGGLNESKLPGYSETIKSTEIISFDYSGHLDHDQTSFYVSAHLTDTNSVHIISSGGNHRERDNSAFYLEYDIRDDTFFPALLNIINKNKMSSDNGHTIHVNGLPEGYGDELHVKFASGEAILKSSNQTKTISQEAIQEIYNLFRTTAIKSSYDFTTDKSTRPIYDDADEQFLQGTWTGRHFGKDCTVIFTGSHVLIYYNHQLTDDTGYVIINGSIQPDKLRSKPIGKRKEDSYEHFRGIPFLRKKNSFTLTGYMTNNNSYSTVDLYKQTSHK